RSINLIQAFRADSVDVSTETCYHFLLMNENDLDKHGSLAKMNPPLRSPSEVEGLWEQLRTEQIDMITSDHAPWYYKDKIQGNDDIFNSPSGLPGIETLIPLMFDATVA